MAIRFRENSQDSAGKFLKALREEKGISIDEVSLETKIKPHFLIAIENGNITDHINLSYAKINIINYSRFLDADIKQILDMFEAEHNLTYNTKIKNDKNKDYQKKILVSKNTLKILMLILLLIVLYSFGSILYKQGDLQRNFFKISNSDMPIDSVQISQTFTDSSSIVSSKKSENITSQYEPVYKTKDIYKKYFMKTDPNPWYVVPEYLKRKS
ncbi:MAG: helix-turn-helix domain-containing protein [Candidatus Cloacimonadota bacterium]|nr:helix-turn-helix domain-containing protein [Candidatus Cloacimonadota bacterium]